MEIFLEQMISDLAPRTTSAPALRDDARPR